MQIKSNDTVRDLGLVRACGCQYIGPTQDPRTVSTVVYCGVKDLVEGAVYCHTHYPLIYQKGSKLRRRVKEQQRAESLRDLMSEFNDAAGEVTADD